MLVPSSLELTRHELPVPAGARGTTDFGPAWLDIGVEVVSDPDRLFQQLATSVGWVEERMWRYEKWVTSPRVVGRVGEDCPSEVRNLGRQIERHYGVNLTRPSAAFYRDGRDLCGFHRDTDLTYLDDTLVALLVLGERRPFVMRPTTAAGQAEDRVVRAGGGDLVVMGGSAQRRWMHGVPMAPGSGGRISVQWRWSSRTGRPETGGSWRAPRRFRSSVGSTGH